MTATNKCKSDFASPIAPAQRGYRPWKSREVRYLKQHKTDGAYLIAHALGRSVSSVQAKAHLLGVSLMYRPGDTCPVCGEHTIHPGTNAAVHRMCVVCWERRKADVMREKAAEERAKRDYDAAKHRKNSCGR